MDPQCGVCGGPATDKKHRMQLHGESAGKFVKILVSYTREHFPGYNFESYTKELPPNQSYICRSCQQRTTKYDKLTAEIQQVSKDIKSDLSQVFSSQAGPSTQMIHTAISTTPTRLRMTTESPAVSVSHALAVHVQHTACILQNKIHPLIESADITGMVYLMSLHGLGNYCVYILPLQ